MDTRTSKKRKNVDINTKTEASQSILSHCISDADGRVSALSSSSSSSSGRVNHHSSTLPTPPDGGWGWVIVFASFMVTLIADGISLSFGVLFVDFVEYFGESRAKTSWVASFFLSMPALAGPIASYLSDRYGCRKVCIAGAILSSGAFIVSIFASSLEFLFLTFSIAGLGLALCYVTSIVVVAYYFEKKRSLATGLSSCGTGIGTFVFPQLTIYLLDEYAWQGTLLILSGFFLNMVVFGALMRDLDDPSDGKSSSSADSDTGPGTGTLEDSERLCSSLVQLPTYLRDNLPLEVISEISNKEGGYLNSLWEQHPQVLNAYVIENRRKHVSDGATPSSARNTPESKRKSKPKRASVNSKPTERRNQFHESCSTSRLDSGYLRNMRFQRSSITYRGAMLNIRRYRLRASSCPDIYRNSMVTISEEKSCLCIEDLKEMLFDMFDLSMFRNIQYTLFCISNFLLYAFVDVPYVYIPDHASNHHVEKESASYLISFLGVLNTLGVVLVGYIGDKPWIDSTLLYSIFIAVSGLMLAIIPWIRDYYGLATIVGIYGFGISANYTLVPVIVVNLISLDNFTGAYGLLLLVQGIASLVGPPIAGWVSDVTGNYDLTFFFSGICIVISGAMVFPFISMLCRCKKRRSLTSDKNLNDDHHAERVRFNDCLDDIYPLNKITDNSELKNSYNDVGNDTIGATVSFSSSTDNIEQKVNTNGILLNNCNDKSIAVYENQLNST